MPELFSWVAELVCWLRFLIFFSFWLPASRWCPFHEGISPSYFRSRTAETIQGNWVRSILNIIVTFYVLWTMQPSIILHNDQLDTKLLCFTILYYNTGEFSGGKCGRCVRLTTLQPPCTVVMKSGNLNFLEHSGPLQACNGTALP